MTEGFWITMAIAFVVTCAAMCGACCPPRGKTCQPGKEARWVQSQCVCVEVPR